MWGTVDVEAQQAVSEGPKGVLIAVASSQNSFRSVFWVMALTPPWTLGTVKWSCGCAAAYNKTSQQRRRFRGISNFLLKTKVGAAGPSVLPHVSLPWDNVGKLARSSVEMTQLIICRHHGHGR